MPFVSFTESHWRLLCGSSQMPHPQKAGSKLGHQNTSLAELESAVSLRPVMIFGRIGGGTRKILFHAWYWRYDVPRAFSEIEQTEMHFTG